MAKHELKTIEDLAAAPYNPRKITQKAKAGLGKSIQRFGDIAGIVWNKRTGKLVTGHQRVSELIEKGAQLIDGELRLGKDGRRFAVRVVDWSESQEKAANVTANNPFIGGMWTEGLGELLPEIKLEVGNEEFGDLMLDKLGQLEVGKPINLGDGEIDNKERTRRIAVFIPEGRSLEAKRKLQEVTESYNGHLAECDHEDCNLSVRDLDPNSWARRRDKLNPQASQKRKDRDSESQDGKGS